MTTMTHGTRSAARKVLASLEEEGPPNPYSHCSIYILDPVQELGLPQCDFTDPTIWPFAKENNTLQNSGPLLPWEHQHAVNYWLQIAIKAAGIQALDPHTADLVRCWTRRCMSFS